MHEDKEKKKDIQPPGFQSWPKQGMGGIRMIMKPVLIITFKRDRECGRVSDIDTERNGRGAVR